jgi:hypothetical protein
MRRGTAMRTALASASLLFVAGCAGEQPGYDDAAVESYLATSQVGTFGPAGKVGDASCPSGLELEEGMTFTCKLEVSGAKLPYRVRLTHVHDAKVSISARPDGVLLSAARLRDYIWGTLPTSSAEAAVDCGGAYVVAKVGATLPCRLTLGSQVKALKVTVKDESGRVSIGS